MMVKIKYKIISLTYCLDPSNFQHLSMSMVAAVKTETPQSSLYSSSGTSSRARDRFPPNGHETIMRCANAEPPPFGCGGVAGVL